MRGGRLQARTARVGVRPYLDADGGRVVVVRRLDGHAAASGQVQTPVVLAPPGTLNRESSRPLTVAVNQKSRDPARPLTRPPRISKPAPPFPSPPAPRYHRPHAGK